MGKPVYSVYWWWAVSVTSNVMLEAWLLMKGNWDSLRVAGQSTALLSTLRILLLTVRLLSGTTQI